MNIALSQLYHSSARFDFANLAGLKGSGSSMTRMLTIAGAACLVLLSASVVPADAGPLYALTGTVGDANWIPADPAIAGPGSLELYRDLNSVFQYNGGPGGLITIDFSGPPIFAERDQEFYSFFSIIATCMILSGCGTSGYSSFPELGGGPQPCCLLYPIDSSFYVQPLETPPFAPYGATFTGYRKGFVGFTFDAFVTADAAGQPFSLTVNTVTAVPEPSVWTLMLAGLLGIGLMLQCARRKPLDPAC